MKSGYLGCALPLGLSRTTYEQAIRAVINAPKPWLEKSIECLSVRASERQLHDEIAILADNFKAVFPPEGVALRIALVHAQTNSGKALLAKGGGAFPDDR